MIAILVDHSQRQFVGPAIYLVGHIGLASDSKLCCQRTQALLHNRQSEELFLIQIVAHVQRLGRDHILSMEALLKHLVPFLRAFFVIESAFGCGRSAVDDLLHDGISRHCFGLRAIGPVLQNRGGDS